MSAVVTTSCPDLELIASGKVRDLYRIDASTLLFVATDRISAFDVIMDNGIPNKGKLLTEISIFWFSLLKDVLPNHFITANFDEFPAKVQPYRAQLEGRSMLVKSLRVLPIESIVRGYITGSAWSEYKKKGTVCDIQLPAGMQQSQAFPEPLWTPSTKAEIGDHDENIHPSKAAGIIGEKHAADMARISVELYTKARDYALERGIIIADTKFEFGVDENDTLYLIDEVLTPDSSRFWPASSYKLGVEQDSFDKQYLRNYLLNSGFDKNKDKGITLPEDIIAETMKKYQEAYKLLTGKDAQL
ncbi:phosphoribosylaminoimidazole-succinocarboxamide synthase [Entomortierella parvispora]|uniref:Phosphoribosylaminoimidazole-succinocarboxamide synthase n=1 Tax=Entomortierella parvispora TaxID=205924 RepID=A0A9P3LUT4_9FUNG|nr:phosphoribosylaminoimidazole-succinocarboxamide synthase [Entomortierella parvispora]